MQINWQNLTNSVDKKKRDVEHRYKFMCGMILALLLFMCVFYRCATVTENIYAWYCVVFNNMNCQFGLTTNEDDSTGVINVLRLELGILLLQTPAKINKLDDVEGLFWLNFVCFVDAPRTRYSPTNVILTFSEYTLYICTVLNAVRENIETNVDVSSIRISLAPIIFNLQFQSETKKQTICVLEAIWQWFGAIRRCLFCSFGNRNVSGASDTFSPQ